MMKAQEQRTQLRGQPIDEIAKKINEMQEELFNLRFQAKMGQLANALQLRMVRRNIARALTILAQKEHEKPAPGKPVQEKPASQKSMQEKPAPKKSAQEKPAPKKSAQEKPAPKKSAQEKSTAKKPVQEKPAPKKAVQEKPASKTPAQEKSALKK
jgi:ribosomal protein L29